MADNTIMWPVYLVGALLVFFAKASEPSHESTWTSYLDQTLGKSDATMSTGPTPRWTTLRDETPERFLHSRSDGHSEPALLDVESEQGTGEQAYGKLDVNELAISPADRLVRVASAFHETGVDVGDWAKKWAAEYKNTRYVREPLSRAFIGFAYEARFGAVPSPFVRSWVREFDIAYRRLNDLAPGEYGAPVPKSGDEKAFQTYLKSIQLTGLDSSTVEEDIARY